jgi:hypothetical protein
MTLTHILMVVSALIAVIIITLFIGLWRVRSVSIGEMNRMLESMWGPEWAGPPFYMTENLPSLRERYLAAVAAESDGLKSYADSWAALRSEPVLNSRASQIYQYMNNAYWADYAMTQEESALADKSARLTTAVGELKIFLPNRKVAKLVARAEAVIAAYAEALALQRRVHVVKRRLLTEVIPDLQIADDLKSRLSVCYAKHCAAIDAQQAATRKNKSAWSTNSSPTPLDLWRPVC